MPTYLQKVEFAGVAVVTLRWPDFKPLVQTKGLPLQYITRSDSYTVFALDKNVAYTCVLVFTSVSATFPFDPDYSQGQNDTDVADFLANFQATANSPTAPTSTNIPGYVTTASAVTTAIRATAYTEQLTGSQRSFSSSSANDAAAGTGARTVILSYYDSTLTTLKTETVTLNGVSAVNTTNTDICFIEKIAVAQVGSGGGNAGTITLFAATNGGGGAVGSIAVGDNQTNWCHHYVRSGHTAYVTGLLAGGKGPSSGSITIRKAYPVASPAQGELVIAPQMRVPAGVNANLPFGETPVPVVGPARITLYALQDSASSSNTWFAGLGYYEV